MKKVILFGNPEKDSIARALDNLQPWLEERAGVVRDTDLNTPWGNENMDFAIALGGDGTMLSAARKFSGDHIPVIGINMGKFGFLTETTMEECHKMLTDVFEERYTISNRMMLRAVLERNKEVIQDTTGLNDVVISRTCLSRLLTIDFWVDGESVNSYRADGLIIATPVGSTAHSLSAGGPIVYPEIDGFVVSPICPHTLSNRPIIVPPDAELEVHPCDYAEPPALTVDGQIFTPLQEDDVVRVHKCDDDLRLIQTGRQHFFQTLRNKLGWSGHPNYVH
ncbi:MAG: NAD(+)/NADH kinase [Planctomycetota bacterium]